MRTEEIRKLLKKEPFRPFRVFLSNGKSYDVTHPELAVVGTHDMFLGLQAEGLEPGVYGHFALVTLIHINNIETLPPAPHVEKNGPA